MDKIEQDGADTSCEREFNVNSSKMRDADLLALTRMANIGAGIGVTLLSKGTVISGVLTSGKKYYEDCEKKLDGKGPIAEAIGSYFAQAKSHYDISEENQIPLNFLHLENVVIMAGSARIPYEGAIFRIKIEEVDGFFIGNVRP
ncbi:hypothetical protein [Klebsiella pneumoniae]|uniref:hypothetical protein n=1 Tax=Klebsiella pneumoniae TaxID=573 RepID=UPI0012387A93|nr:hypothetical protein [Klebsiella pneumoniae]QET15127.1 hypothetical protein FOB39_16405 [Klebsiella pneumoniae]